MSQNNWEADKMLDVYIYDYLLKRKLHASAKAFQTEGKVSTDPVAIDAPGGFLFEWWSVFWDIFIARTNEKHSESAASYIESQVIKAREQQQQQQQQHQKPQQHQQMQVQQLLLQRHAQQQQQQQRRDSTQHLNDTGDDLRPGFAKAFTTKMYEDRLKKLPFQRDSLDDATIKPRLSDNMTQLLDPNHATLLKAAAIGSQPSGQTLHGTHGVSQQVQSRSQQPPLSTQEVKTEMNPTMNPRAAGSEGSLIGVHGSNQGAGNVTLKGWPLTGLDQFRSGLLQQQKSLTQPYNQLQLQQLMLQAQQNLASPSANDLESRKLRMLHNSRNMGLARDGSSNSVGDLVSTVGSAMQIISPGLPRGDNDLLIKIQQQQQQLQHYSHHPLSSQQSQNSNPLLQQQDKILAGGSMTMDGSMSNTFQGNDQASKNQIGRKRKQAVSSSGPANSSGTANTPGPTPSSPSSPSTHTPGDVISRPTLQHNGASSKSLLMFGSDGMGSLTSAPNQLTDMDRFVDDGSLDDNVESFLSPDDADPRDRVGRSAEVGKGFTFTEFQLIPASTSKVESCHFSPDGKLLATGGHDKKAVLWCTESFTVKSTLEEHTQWITDVRFSPSLSRLATSSADRTVRVWDTENPDYSLRTFTGHSTTVMSLDFHPSKEDLLCSCDNNSEIRYWSINNGSCAGVFKCQSGDISFPVRVLGCLLSFVLVNKLFSRVFICSYFSKFISNSVILALSGPIVTVTDRSHTNESPSTGKKSEAMASTTEGDHREEEAPHNEDEDTGAQVAPIVKLEEVAVTTGEEDEDAILDLKAKLYRFDKDGNQWKERGAGTVKLLKHKVTGKVRLVMRQSKTLKICANHLVLPMMSVQEHAGNDKSCVWHAADYADGELKDELFCIRFGSVENCKSFMEMVHEVAESQKKKEENKDASATAGLLEKLSVEENKTEDKSRAEGEVPKEEKEEEEVPKEEKKESKSEEAEKKPEEPASST